MKTRSKTRMEKAHADRISNLPSEVMEAILACLSLREAVRSGILSSKWKHKWKTRPTLVFDDKCVHPSSSDSIKDCMIKYVTLVTKVIVLHRGPIHKLELSGKYLLSCPAFEFWIKEFVSWRDIKELTLEFADDDMPFRLPDCVFSYQNLIELKLVRCSINPPSGYGKFSNLTSLILQKCELTSSVIEDLLSKCPRLEFFWLKCYGSMKLVICSRSLKVLFIEGEFKHLYIEALFLQALHVDLYRTETISNHLEETTSFDMVDLVGFTPLLNEFIAKNYFIKYLTNNMPDTSHQHRFMRKLELYHIDFRAVDQIEVVNCVIENSPNLVELICSSLTVVGADGQADLGFWENEHLVGQPFGRLRIVKIVGITGSPNEIEFIKYLLAKSPVLERMRISVFATEFGCKNLVKLLEFPRASGQARVSVINLDTDVPQL